MRISMRSLPLVLVAALAVPAPSLAADPPAAQEGPRISLDDVAEASPSRLSDSELSALKRLLAATPESSAERPQLLFRLAEHSRAVWLESLAERRALGAKLGGAREPFGRAALRARLQRAQQMESAWRAEAAKLYAELVQRSAPRGPGAHARLDEVLYHLADLMRRAQRIDQARVFFARLIRDYPQSAYVPDAYIVFADHYFDEGKLPEAQKLYQVVTRFPTARVAGYARYREGWCELRQGDPRGALERFVSVVRDPDMQRHATLAQELRRSIVIAYAQVGVSGRALPFFQRVGGTESKAMLKQLGAIYRAKGRAADAAVVEAAAR
jgi:TolA-binding protein